MCGFREVFGCRHVDENRDITMIQRPLNSTHGDLKSPKATEVSISQAHLCRLFPLGPNRGMKSFQSFRLDTTTTVFGKWREAGAKSPKAFDVLRYLVENPGRLVTTRTSFWRPYGRGNIVKTPRS